MNKKNIFALIKRTFNEHPLFLSSSLTRKHSKNSVSY
jgi:hypothetical protein